MPAIASPDLSFIIVIIFLYSFYYTLLAVINKKIGNHSLFETPSCIKEAANQLTGFNMKPGFSESFFLNRL